MAVILNALAETGDINAAVDYFAKHGHKIRPELFYSKILLDTIKVGKEHYVHYRLADVKPIQNKATKLQLRRWSPLNAHTIPLVEGVPPKSDKGSLESYEQGVHQYGRYMEFTDKVEWEIIDPIITHYTAQYSEVALETLDLLAREALLAVPNNYFAGMVSSIGGLKIGPASKPALEDLRVIVLGMKKRLVKPRSNGRYHVIGTPDFTFDMVTDPLVEKYLTINQTTKSVYNDGTLPPLFNMEFYETMASDTRSEYTDMVGAIPTKALRVYRADATDPSGYVYETIYEKDNTGADTGYYKKRTDFYKGDGGWNFANDELNAIPEEYVWDVDKFNVDKGAVADPFEPLSVHKVLVLGKDCLIRTNVDGKDNAQMFVKPLGSAGVLDPINQRQSIGFKINTVGFGVERNETVAIYNCLPTQANV